jgi:hypothetical protein
MGILTLLRNAFGRSRKARAAEAEGAERTPSQEPRPTVPSPRVPEPHSSAQDDEHDLVSAAFDNVTIPDRPATAEEPTAAGESAVAEEPTATAEEPVATADEPTVTEEPVAVAEEPVTTAEEPTPETPTEAVPEPEAVTEAAPEAEVVTEPAPEPEAVTEPAPEPEAVTEAAPEVETLAEPEPEPTPEAAPEPEPTAEASSEPVIEPEPAAEAEPAIEPEPEAAAEPQPEPVTEEPTPEPVTEPEPVAAAADTQAAPEPETTDVPKAADEPVAAEADEPIAADGEDAPQGPPAADNETRTGGAGGNNKAEGGAEAVDVTPLPQGLTTAYNAAATALANADLTHTRADVYLVLDRSASMRPYYKDGSAQALGEQTLALAAHLAPESKVHVVFFSTELDGTGELTLTDHENKIDDLHASLGRMGRTSYHAAVQEVITHREKSGDPTSPALVVFQTDGAPDAKTPATQSLTDAAQSHPSVFFSFVAFGAHDNKAFDYLRKLKTDNTSFFHAGPTPRELTDAELYEGVLANWRP